jgi:hypothetical protein
MTGLTAYKITTYPDKKTGTPFAVLANYITAECTGQLQNAHHGDCRLNRAGKPPLFIHDPLRLQSPR